MTNQRHQFRMPVSRRGLVMQQKTTALCELRDITEQGLHFSTDLPLALDETVRIECQLDVDCIIHCEVLSLMLSLQTSVDGSPTFCRNISNSWCCSFNA